MIFSSPEENVGFVELFGLYFKRTETARTQENLKTGSQRGKKRIHSNVLTNSTLQRPEKRL